MSPYTSDEALRLAVANADIASRAASISNYEEAVAHSAVSEAYSSLAFALIAGERV